MNLVMETQLRLAASPPATIPPVGGNRGAGDTLRGKDTALPVGAWTTEQPQLTGHCWELESGRNSVFFLAPLLQSPAVTFCELNLVRRALLRVPAKYVLLEKFIQGMNLRANRQMTSTEPQLPFILFYFILFFSFCHF